MSGPNPQPAALDGEALVQECAKRIATRNANQANVAQRQREVATFQANVEKLNAEIAAMQAAIRAGQPYAPAKPQ